MVRDKFLRKVLGIEFRNDSLVITCLKQDITGIKLISSMTLPFHYHETNEETISEVKRFVTQYRINTKSVSLSIPKEWGLIKFMDVPSPGEDTLGKLIHYEIERHVPFPIEDIYYDFQVMSKNGNSYRVLLVVVQKERIEKLKEFLMEIPLQAETISLTSFSILNAIELSGNNTNVFKELSGLPKRSDVFASKDSLCGSLFMDQDEWEMAVMKDGSCIYLKNIPFDRNRQLDVLWDEVFNEINTTLARFSIGKIDRLVLSGNGSSEILQSIAEKSGIEVTVVDHFKSFSIPKKGMDMYKLFPSFGACLAGFGHGSLKINVLPYKSRRNHKTGPFITKLSLLIILFLFGGLILSGIIKEKLYLQSIDEEIRKNKPEVAAIEKLSSELSAVEERHQFLLNEKVNNISKLELLAELTDIIPPDAWLTNLIFKDKNQNDRHSGEIIISGFAESSSKLILLLENSVFFENVEFNGPIRKSRYGEGFKIKALVVKPEGEEANKTQ